MYTPNKSIIDNDKTISQPTIEFSQDEIRTIAED